MRRMYLEVHPGPRGGGSDWGLKSAPMSQTFEKIETFDTFGGVNAEHVMIPFFFFLTHLTNWGSFFPSSKWVNWLKNQMKGKIEDQGTELPVLIPNSELRVSSAQKPPMGAHLPAGVSLGAREAMSPGERCLSLQFQRQYYK